MNLLRRSARLMPKSFTCASLLGRSGLRVVLYHNVTADPGPLVEGLEISTPPDVWERHLDFYARNYDIVDLDTVLTGKLPRRPLLITFDDAYRTVLDVAAPILKRRSMPAVFFVIPSAVGSTRLILDNLLCYLVATAGVERVETAITGRPATTESLGQLVREVASALPYEERITLADRLTQHFGVDHAGLLAKYPLYLQPADIRRLVEMGIEIANHTLSHVHCRALDDEQSATEIARAREELERLSGRPVRAFSYPYGNLADVTATVQETAGQSGHEALFLVQARANRRERQGRDFYYRVGLDGCDPRDLFVNIEILPRLRSLASGGR